MSHQNPTGRFTSTRRSNLPSYESNCKTTILSVQKAKSKQNLNAMSTAKAKLTWLNFMRHHQFYELCHSGSREGFQVQVLQTPVSSTARTNCSLPLLVSNARWNLTCRWNIAIQYSSVSSFGLNQFHFKSKTRENTTEKLK